MSEEQVREMMRRDVKAAGSMRAFAKEVGVTVAYISDILLGRRHVGPSVAKHYGLKLETRYVRLLRRVVQDKEGEI